MGLSIEELELQSSECLPAREVMTLLGGNGGSWGSDTEPTQQGSIGLVAANVDADDAGVLNDADVCVTDTADVAGNDLLNGVANQNAILSVLP